MSIKRNVTITCDGPCGTAVSQGTIPEGWTQLTLRVYPHNEKSPAYDGAHLCPKCVILVRKALDHLHVALTSLKKEDLS